jgi:hypothetical protein
MGEARTDVTLPKFHLFKSLKDAPISYTVKVKTTDEELKSLLWSFREKVRGGRFKEFEIMRPISKQWDEYGYKSDMLLIYRGSQCANEQYISLEDAKKGRLGPCGYGEHDDASYQWGIEVTGPRF